MARMPYSTTYGRLGDVARWQTRLVICGRGKMDKYLYEWIDQDHRKATSRRRGHKGTTSHESMVLEGHAAIVKLPFLDDNDAYLLIGKASIDPTAPYVLLDVGREVTLRYRNGHKYIWTT
ncbi:hypothetical protein SPRG_14649 [Saprolegnia parasitica CBS 223.65]|uniref:Uncharacterized protein n=1 Tax=Saprolegnia parasitica (strain CBS 223.65) TaxID=695850 RepID=A0A067BYR2_SAPPC|nr:hypothetical protein SPRG_14649 [Saprolegnia parasitica CBS 223.65]KDO19466.1 hypothetical protein SPRG_14649 [Saprolegnia parasitica CBS 223.65]|eukprot:XP_012209810.1 hypothetical protein SPRG_14649 [Saprolegnia parasitica CBS 223.65]